MTNSDPETVNSRRVRRFLRNRSAIVGATLVGVLIAVAISAGALAPFAPDKLVDEPFLDASATHLFGTDSVGRDVLTRVLYGSRLSLTAGATAIALAILIGVPIGAIAGYAGGWFDLLAMRGIDVVLSFPSILVALVLVVAISPGWWGVILAVAFINVPVFCRQVRAAVLTIRHQDYVMASRAAGATVGHMFWRVIVPGIVSPVIVLATLGLGTAILEIAGLSFLGLLVDPTEPEWGGMLRTAKDSLSRARACTWLAPGAAISLTVLGFSLLGDGLRDLFEPR
jgi:peptide/nickel transport system permease protein